MGNDIGVWAASKDDVESFFRPGEETTMATECRMCWRNCAVEADAEMLEIDRLDDALGSVDPNVTKIRELISTLELCHHKAERWVESIIEAIGSGQTRKGLGTRPPGQAHPVETIWQNACAALSAWCAGSPAGSVELTVGSAAASQLLAGLGTRRPLKEWQVQRVIDRIRNLIHWPQSDDDPTAQYTWLLLNDGEYECVYRDQCPQQYREHEDFWRTTAQTILRDTHHGKDAELSLALAIDMLWPCHWRFVENLRIVLDAIGGELNPKTPFAACGRNIRLVPNRERLETVSESLRTFCGSATGDGATDKQILALLGASTDAKRWLALSLDKTIRLQLDPSPELQALSALEGPAWIK